MLAGVAVSMSSARSVDATYRGEGRDQTHRLFLEPQHCGSPEDRLPDSLTRDWGALRLSRQLLQVQCMLTFSTNVPRHEAQ